MFRSLLSTGSLTLCWLLSPDSLSIAGNSIGKGGWNFLIPFFLAFLISCWASDIIYRVTRHTNIGIQPSRSFAEISHPTSDLICIALTFGCCLSLVLFIPTGALFTAGYVVNETSLYQYPPVNISFLLLGAILIPYLLNEKLPGVLQVLSFCITICCLLILIIFCLHGGQEYLGNATQQGPILTSPEQQSVSFWVLFCTSMLLFLGYDQGKSYLLHWRYRVLLLAAGAIIIGLWSAASMLQFPQAQLAQSTIQYILGFQENLSDAEKTVFGVMIICGSFSVVNGLFIITFRLITQQLVTAMPRNPAVFSIIHQRSYTLSVSTVIALFLATGLEWREEIEIFIYGSLLLWLLLTAVRIHGGLRAFKKAGGNTPGIHFFLPIIIFIAFLSLIVIHSQPATIMVYLALVLLVSFIITAAWLFSVKGYHKSKLVPIKR